MLAARVGTLLDPGFIQGANGAPGNFEVVVLVGGGQLEHLWRDSFFAWHEGPRFGAKVELSGAALVQGDYYGNDPGNLECVASSTPASCNTAGATSQPRPGTRA
jgi:hypothetical protein